MAYSDTNKVKFGISDLWFAKLNEDGTYSGAFANPGAVSASLDPSGDKTDFYADNTLYYSEDPNNGYEGDVEVAKFVDQFYTDILGQTEDGDKLIESRDDVHSKFAMGFQTKGDKVTVRVLYYRCSTTRPSSEASTTEESNEPQTETATITSSVANVGTYAGRIKAKEVYNKSTATTATTFEEWFKDALGITEE